MFHKWLLKDLLQIRFKSLEVATNQFPRAINHSRFHFSFSHPLLSLHLCASLSIWRRGLNALYGPIISLRTWIFTDYSIQLVPVTHEYCFCRNRSILIIIIIITTIIIIIITGTDQHSDQLSTRGLQEVCLDDTEAALPDSDQDITRPLPGIEHFLRQIF